MNGLLGEFQKNTKEKNIMEYLFNIFLVFENGKNAYLLETGSNTFKKSHMQYLSGLAKSLGLYITKDLLGSRKYPRILFHKEKNIQLPKII